LREAADREAAVQAELGNRTRLLEEKAAESQQRAQRVAEFELQLRSSQSELDDARRQLGELNQKIAEMAETKAQALKEAADREAAVQSELTHRIWLLDVKVSENQERTQRIAELDAQIANDARLLEERATNLRTANERLSSLESEAAAHKTLVEVLGKGRSQQDKLYKELSQEKDGLRAEIERLNRRIFELEALVASKETHENLLDIEFQKVEGQIELIKEIFLQERR
jgi:chromosome segregation ATPase